MAGTTKKTSKKRGAKKKKPAATRGDFLPYKALGKALRANRERCGLTLSSVVDHLREHGLVRGETDGTLRSWERGRYCPPFDAVVALCDLYGITPDHLSGSPAPAAQIVLVDEHVRRELTENAKRYSAAARRRLFARSHFFVGAETRICVDDGTGKLVDALITELEDALALR